MPSPLHGKQNMVGPFEGARSFRGTNHGDCGERHFRPLAEEVCPDCYLTPLDEVLERADSLRWTPTGRTRRRFQPYTLEGKSGRKEGG